MDYTTEQLDALEQTMLKIPDAHRFEVLDLISAYRLQQDLLTALRGAELTMTQLQGAIASLGTSHEDARVLRMGRVKDHRYPVDEITMYLDPGSTPDYPYLRMHGFATSKRDRFPVESDGRYSLLNLDRWGLRSVSWREVRRR